MWTGDAKHFSVPKKFPDIDGLSKTRYHTLIAKGRMHDFGGSANLRQAFLLWCYARTVGH